MSKIEQALAELGLAPTEVTVYLELMRLGMAPASVIAKRVGLPRSTVHYTCQLLRKKGLTSVIQKQNTFLFAADDPSTLRSVLDLQRREIERKEEKFEDMVRQLRAMRSPLSATAGVRLLEGKEGIASGLKLLLDKTKPGDEILAVINPLDGKQDPHDLYPTALRFQQERAARKVRLRGLICDGPLAADLKGKHETEFAESRIMKGKFPFPAGQILLFSDCAFCMSGARHAVSCFIIEETVALGLLRGMFENVWQSAA